MVGNRPPRSIKPEASFIPEKEKKEETITTEHTAEITAKDRASEIVAMETLILSLFLE